MKENIADFRINSGSRLRILRAVGKNLVREREYIWRRDIFSIVKKNKNWDVSEGKRWRFVEKSVYLRRNKNDFDMAKGNSWKTRNRTAADFGLEGRKIVKRELKGKRTGIQFKLMLY